MKRLGVICLALLLCCAIAATTAQEYTFGRAMLPYFYLEKNGTFINHGSYGSPPREVMMGMCANIY